MSTFAGIALEACVAAIEYDDAIRKCANDPKRMASFCTSQGDDLDTLYFAWMTKARLAVQKEKEEKEK